MRNPHMGTTHERTRVELLDAVVDVVSSIPPGRVASYGSIGGQLGIGARQIGKIMSVLSELGEDLPWWRVVRADGMPASCHGGEACGRLEAEGTPFRGARVDMRRARQADWSGPAS
jgi:alkylated DNA nucleotide flippase Atl1